MAVQVLAGPTQQTREHFALVQKINRWIETYLDYCVHLDRGVRGGGDQQHAGPQLGVATQGRGGPHLPHLAMGI